MNRKEILAAANKAVHAEDMDHDYGKPEDNFATIADLWNTYLEAVCDDPDLSVYLSSRDVAAMMILLKIARVAASEKADHWIDIAGYAACGGEVDGWVEKAKAQEETATTYADNKELDTIVLQSLGDITGEGNGPFELRFTVKKEDE